MITTIILQFNKSQVFNPLSANLIIEFMNILLRPKYFKILLKFFSLIYFSKLKNS